MSSVVNKLLRQHLINLLAQRSELFFVVQAGEHHNLAVLIDEHIAGDARLAVGILGEVVGTRVEGKRIGHACLFQAGNKGFLPIEKDWKGQVAGKVVEMEEATLWYLNDAPRATLVIESSSKEKAACLFDAVYRSLTVKPGEEEPMMNVLAMYEENKWVVFVFPREKHRPACYTAEGDANLLSSPASVDLGGVFITPVEKDFLKITAEDVAQILSEVCLSASDFEQLRKRIQEQF